MQRYKKKRRVANRPIYNILIHHHNQLKIKQLRKLSTVTFYSGETILQHPEMAKLQLVLYTFRGVKHRFYYLDKINLSDFHFFQYFRTKSPCLLVFSAKDGEVDITLWMSLQVDNQRIGMRHG